MQPPRLVLDLANRQFGVVTRPQLLQCGITSSAISRWTQVGRLSRLYPGVYAVGHAALTVAGRRLAAVLACGPQAGMSFSDGGAVWGLCPSRGSRFHVTVPRSGPQPGRRAGIHVHTTSRPLVIVVHDGIPVTSVAHTLRDLAATLPPDDVAAAVDAAFTLDLFDQVAIDAECGPGRPGSARLQRVIAERQPDAHHTRSGWERKMLRLLDRHDLPRPAVNASLHALGVTPDLLWLREGLVVEWDSWAHHRTRDRFESDRAKTVVLQNAGFTVLRFTWRQTTDQPELVAGSIRHALTHNGGLHV